MYSKRLELEVKAIGTGWCAIYSLVYRGEPIECEEEVFVDKLSLNQWLIDKIDIDKFTEVLEKAPKNAPL